MSDDVRAREPARRDRVFLTCLALVLLPFVVGLVKVAFVHWTPVGDWALLELRARSVGGAHTPLVGPYSRFGWSHPGPALFYALAGPYRIFGGRANGILAAVLLINGASVAGLLIVAWRRGRRPLTIATAIAVALLCHALGATFLRDPWNPYVTVLPFALLVFLAWSIACGDAWAVPVAAFVASFVGQTHVGYAALVVTVLVVATAWRVVVMVRARRQEHPRARPRSAAITLVTIGVVVLAWLPPLLDQIANPGNLDAIWKFFQKRHKTPTLDTGFRLVGRALAVPATWVTGHEQVSTAHLFVPAVAGFFVPVALFTLVVAFVVSARGGDRDALALTVLVLATLGAGVYSIAHVAGVLAAYLLRWLLALGMLAWLASVWAWWPAIARLHPGRATRRVLALAAAALLVVPVALATTAAARARAPWYSVGVVEQHLARDTLAHLQTDGHPILILSNHEQWFTWGLAARLDAAGIPLAARPVDVLYYGRHRVSLRHQAHLGVVVVVGPNALTTGRPIGGRLLASYTGGYYGSHRFGPTADYGAIVHLSELNLRSDTVAVYEVQV
ncbi:MAG TPA: hypothetical protein VH914_21235 [Acidimicrobiia bacterium]|jgi:hypothetical protein|nr:hypothetical protein [Acidimicrobiia bacterium]